MVKTKKSKTSNEKKEKHSLSPGLHGVKKSKVGKKVSVNELPKAILPNAGEKCSKSQKRHLRKRLLKKGMEERGCNISSKRDLNQKNKKRKMKNLDEISKLPENNPQGKNKSLLKSFIMGLPRRTNSEAVNSAFNEAGVHPIGVKIVKGEQKTYCIATFDTESSLNEAVSLSKKLKIDGKIISIRKFKENRKKEGKHSEQEAEHSKGIGKDSETSEGEEDEEKLIDSEGEQTEGDNEIKNVKLTDEKKSVLIKMLNPGVSASDLRTAFENKGLSVSDAKVVKKGLSSFGLLHFSNYSDYNKLLTFDKQMKVNGKTVRIILPKKPSQALNLHKNVSNSPSLLRKNEGGNYSATSKFVLKKVKKRKMKKGTNQ